MGNPSGPIDYTSQEIDNWSFDKVFKQSMVENVGFDGYGLQRKNADALNYKITTVGNNKYIAIAPPGTAQSAAGWQCRLLADDGNGTLTITWANGSPDFSNVATDLTILSYS